jgi:hypothetical protein
MDNRRVYRLVLATRKEGTRIGSFRASDGTWDPDLSPIGAGEAPPEPRRVTSPKGPARQARSTTRTNLRSGLSLIHQFEQSTPTGAVDAVVLPGCRICSSLTIETIHLEGGTRRLGKRNKESKSSEGKANPRGSRNLRLGPVPSLAPGH